MSNAPVPAPVPDPSVSLRRATAMLCASRGWLLTPLAGKIPTLTGWESAPAPTAADVERWVERGNIGLRTGSVSGVVVVDVDSAKGGEVPASLRGVKTPTVMTGGGGLHLYFACPSDGMRNSVGRLGPHVDVRGDKGQVVAVGSVHPTTGNVYAWAPGLSPAEIPLATLPDDVLATLRAPRAKAIAKPAPAAPTSVRLASHGGATVAAHAARTTTAAPAGVGGWALTRYGERALWDECDAVRRAASGTRNDRLNRAAFAVGQLLEAGHLIDESFCVEQLVAAGEAAGLDDHEIGPTIRSGLDGGRVAPRTSIPDPRGSLPASNARTPPATTAPKASRQPGEDDDEEPATGAPAATSSEDDAETFGGFHLTDLGNAQRIVLRNGEDLRHAVGLGWLRWDGVRWERVEDGKHVMRLAYDVSERLIEDAKGIADPEVAKKVRSWGLKSQSAPRVHAMVELAGTLTPIAAQVMDFDATSRANLVVCANGTLDLGTGTLRPSARADMMTRRVSVRYDPDAPCPTWESFLSRIFSADAELLDWLQRACGYTLTGSTREQVMFLCHGSLGQNGKSTFLGTIRYVMGEIARHADFGSFLARGASGSMGGQARGDLARLMGARLVTAVEPDEWARFSESTVKSITGGDPITARHMYEREFEYVPTFKLWMAANHRPRVSGTDLAFWRRVRLIPFAVQIPAAERDNELESKLRQEAEGIFAWMVRGAREWLDRGLAPPACVVVATEDYREENDMVGSWVSERCVVDPLASATAVRLYRDFKQWLDDAGEQPWSQTRFGRAMAEKGYTRERSAGAGRETYYRGLDLASGLFGAGGGT